MAVSTVQQTDIAEALTGMLAGIDGLRTEMYVADNSRPPVAVVNLPTIDWEDPESTFCWASWEFGITIVTSRANDRDAQSELSRLVRDVANALKATPPLGIFSVDPLDARPTTVSISGQELPAYQLRVRVRA